MRGALPPAPMLRASVSCLLDAVECRSVHVGFWVSQKPFAKSFSSALSLGKCQSTPGALTGQP